MTKLYRFSNSSKIDWTSSPDWFSDSTDVFETGMFDDIVVGVSVKVWSGSAWVAKTLVVRDGSAFVVDPTAIKVWNGSAWVNAI